MNEMGYFRVAAAVPEVKPAAIRQNADAIIHGFHQACEKGADLVVFPELSVTGYTCADLFFQTHLLETAEQEALRIIEETSARGAIMVFGMPLSRRGRLYNVAVVVRGGTQILGVVPKTYIPNAREYYEQRWFSSAEYAVFDEVSIAGQKVPFGTDLLFRHEEHKRTTFAVEICEDLWSPIPPSGHHAVAGAQMLFNLSASNELVAKADYRRQLVSQQSARCLAGYIYVSAGCGESTTDTVFGGHALIAENGVILAESQRFLRDNQMIIADIDTMLLDHERRTSPTFGMAVGKAVFSRKYRHVHFAGRLHHLHNDQYNFLRTVNRYPFVPSNIDERQKRCQEILSIQSTALSVRMNHIGFQNAVIGLSGGLDSTLALLVTIMAFERLEYSRDGIVCLTMPGFGTTDRTLGNVEKLCTALGLMLEKIDIRHVCQKQFEDLKHSGTPEDVAYENVQARYRTSLLMNKANMTDALLVGTGDLSELALGWCTYNGDHMSMYGVNSGVPKTLVRYLIAWVAESWAPPDVRTILEDVLNTPVSPELLPPNSKGEISQKTEEMIGPYDLHDFFLFYAIRYGFGPIKVLRLSQKAFGEDYSESDILKWLELFYKRFFASQFKRSCLPDGPKVGSLALSPRSDWRMPSDVDAELWVEELAAYRNQAKGKG